MDINPLWAMLVMLVLLFTGMPVGIIMGFVGLVFGYLAFGNNFLGVLSGKVFGLLTDYIFVTMPMFIFMGNMLERAGSTEEMYDAMYIVMGKIKGGLAYATVIIGTIFAAATGVIGASVTTMGLIGIPSMLKRGYQPGISMGVVMASGTLGMLIPPSVMLVMLGSWAEVSVGRLYMACLGPGLILACFYAIYIFVYTKKNPASAPGITGPELDRYTGGQKAKMLVKAAVPPIALIIIVMGVILVGIATPTEAAGLGAVGALLIAAATRRLTFKAFKEACIRSAKSCGMIGIVGTGAYVFVATFLRLGGAKAVSSALTAGDLGKWGTYIVIMLLLFVMGMFLDWFGILVILTPVFMPIIKSLGFDPVWFCALVAVNLQMSFLTPPFGYALFYVKGIIPQVAPGIKTSQIFSSIWPYCGMVVLGLVLFSAFPNIVLAIPNAIYGK